MTTTTEKTGIMDCPNSELKEICMEAFRRWDDYQQLAGDQGKPEVGSELAEQMHFLEVTYDAIKNGKVLTTQERNELRIHIKFTEKWIATELILTEEPI